MATQIPRTQEAIDWRLLLQLVSVGNSGKLYFGFLRNIVKINIEKS